MDSEENRRGRREVQVLARQIILTSRSLVEARRRIRRLRKKLVSVSRHH